MSTSLSFDKFPQEILSKIFSNLNLDELITMYFNKIHKNIFYLKFFINLIMI